MRSGFSSCRHLDRLLAVERHDDLIALAQQPARQHVAVHLVVFDQEDLRHRIITLLDVPDVNWCACRLLGGGLPNASANRFGQLDAGGRLLGHDLRRAARGAVLLFGASAALPSGRRPGRSLSAGRSCMASRKANPSITGIIRSSRISAGGGWLSSQRSASMPFAASAAAKPSFSSRRRVASRVDGIVLDEQNRAGRRPGRYWRSIGCQAGAVDRLGHEVGGAEREGHAAVLQDRHHDDRNVAQVRVGLQRHQDRPAVHARHQHVERDACGRCARACARASSPVRAWMTR